MPARHGALVALLAAVACRQTAVVAGTPAHLAAASTEARAEVERALHELLGEREIRLGDDALLDSSVLLLERAIQERLDERVLGRELDAPERFELLLDGRGCYLVRLSQGTAVRLRTRCVPAP